MNMNSIDLVVLLVQKGCWAAIAAVGFAVLFNVPKYVLPHCALIGALGYALRVALMSNGMGIVLATLCAALFIGVLATIMSQKYGVSETLFSVGPAIPMIPGSYAYKAVIGLVTVANSPDLEYDSTLLLAAFENGIKAILTVLFLSFGIALPSLIWSTFRRRKK